MNTQSNEGRAQVVDERGTGTGLAAGTEARRGFGTEAIERRAETAGAALAAQAKAQVEARYIVAMQKPRSWADVRQRLLDECRRPRFAQVARYLKPIGRGVEGPSIRFAEAALRCMTNVIPETATIFDDETKRIFRVAVTDLEANVTYSQDVVIEKTVERTNLRDGQEAITSRTNSSGKRTYLVAATDDDLLNKQNALISKALRTLALRLLPGDILDEAMDLVIRTQKDEDAKDPNFARNSMTDAYARIGVKVEAIADYLGHSVDSITADELAELRALGLAIKDGEANWREALEAKKKAREAGDSTNGGSATVAPLKERIKAQAKKGAAAKEPEPAKTTPAPPPQDAKESEAAATLPVSPPPPQTRVIDAGAALAASEKAKGPISNECAVCGNEIDFAKDGELADGHAFHRACRTQADRG